MDGQTDGWTDRWMDRQMDGQTDGWTDRWMNGRADRQMDERDRIYLYFNMVFYQVIIHSRNINIWFT